MDEKTKLLVSLGAALQQTAFRVLSISSVRLMPPD